jgi:hypothetical protein
MIPASYLSDRPFCEACGKSFPEFEIREVHDPFNGGLFCDPCSAKRQMVNQPSSYVDSLKPLHRLRKAVAGRIRPNMIVDVSEIDHEKASTK